MSCVRTSGKALAGSSVGEIEVEIVRPTPLVMCFRMVDLTTQP